MTFNGALAGTELVFLLIGGKDNANFLKKWLSESKAKWDHNLYEYGFSFWYFSRNYCISEIWNYLITMFFHYKNSPLQLEKFVFNVECILQGMMTQTGELAVIGKLYTCKLFFWKSNLMEDVVLHVQIKCHWLFFTPIYLKSHSFQSIL